MRQKGPGKAIVLIAVCSLFACQPKEVPPIAESPEKSLYSLPETVDYERAAKLNIELGLGYLKQGQTSRAKSKFNRAKNLAPNLSEVYYSLGYFHEHVGEAKEAEKAYQKAINLNPKGGIEHDQYGSFLCRQHQYQKAEKEYLKSIEDPNYTNMAETLESVGICVLQIPEITKAVDYFERALRYDPNRTNALLELAIIKYQEGKLAQAKEYHKRFTKLSKATSRSLLLGVELAKKMGDKDKEASYQLMLKAQFPEARPRDLVRRVG